MNPVLQRERYIMRYIRKNPNLGRKQPDEKMKEKSDATYALWKVLATE